MLFIWTLALFAAIGIVSVAGTFVAYKDDWFLLPCVCREPVRSESLSFFWRDKDDRVVLDIINGKTDKIDPVFASRVVSFPDEYKHGNFSIVITKLRIQDTGPYDCNVPHVSFETKMFLKVTERPLMARANTTGKADVTVTKDANGVGCYTQSVTMISICLGTFFFVFTK